MRRPGARDCRSDRAAEHGGEVMVDGVQVLRGRIHRPELDDEAVCRSHGSRTPFRRVRPVPGEMHGLAVARSHPRALAPASAGDK